MVSTIGNRRHLIQGESRWSFEDTALLPEDHQHFVFVLFLFLFSIGVQLIDNVCSFQVYSKAIQLYTYMYLFFFQFLSYLGEDNKISLLQDIEQSSLCYTVGPCWLSILNTAVCTCPSQTPIPLLHPFSLVTISSFPKSVSLCH